MSRIDEALRRAAGERVAGVQTSGPVNATPVEVVLDRYPREAAGTTAPNKATTVVHPAPSRLKVAPAPQRASRGPSQTAMQFGEKLLSAGDPRSVPVEQYRRLAASLHGLQAERGVKTLMVTSAVPQEGKTLTATNLALALSDSYAKRVLLIDADVRRPGVHHLLGIGNEVGLTDVLDGGRESLPVVEISPRLHVVPAGRSTANALAGLVSERMRTLVEDAETRYDWVLIDTPPVGVMAEAQLLARVTHGVIFVIRARSTAYPAIERSINELGREAIAGIVLNDAAEDAIPAVAYYHDYADGSR